MGEVGILRAGGLEKLTNSALGNSQKGGVRLQHVPFSSSAKLANDLMGGHIAVGLVDMATGTPLVTDGKLKALAVCGGRSPS